MPLILVIDNYDIHNFYQTIVYTVMSVCRSDECICSSFIPCCASKRKQDNLLGTNTTKNIYKMPCRLGKKWYHHLNWFYIHLTVFWKSIVAFCAPWLHSDVKKIHYHMQTYVPVIITKKYFHSNCSNILNGQRMKSNPCWFVRT